MQISSQAIPSQADSYNPIPKCGFTYLETGFKVSLSSAKSIRACEASSRPKTVTNPTPT